MGYEIPIIIAYNTLLLLLGAAWVGGYLDSAQRTAQDLILGKMGDNRASFGVKTLAGQQFTDNKDVNKAQGDAANTAGGAVGKGGVGEGAGDALSKGL